MSQFTDRLEVTPLPGGKLWELLKAFEYHVGHEGSGEVVVVQAEFVTDFASIPRWAWPVIGHPVGEYGKAAVIHDWLYQYPCDGLPIAEPERTKRRCDQIFLEGMRVLGVSWWKRSVMYFAVKVGGGGAWEKYRNREG